MRSQHPWVHLSEHSYALCLHCVEGCFRAMATVLRNCDRNYVTRGTYWLPGSRQKRLPSAGWCRRGMLRTRSHFHLASLCRKSCVYLTLAFWVSLPQWHCRKQWEEHVSFLLFGSWGAAMFIAGSWCWHHILTCLEPFQVHGIQTREVSMQNTHTLTHTLSHTDTQSHSLLHTCMHTTTLTLSHSILTQSYTLSPSFRHSHNLSH